MSRMSDRRTVLVLHRSILKRDRDELAGIYEYAREAGWSVQNVEYGTAMVGRFHGASVSEPTCDVRSLLSLWHPSGCILECGGERPNIAPSRFGRVPVVFLDCPSFKGGNRVACVSSNAKSIADCAANELLPLGFSDYAFVPWPKDTVWSRERQIEFSGIVSKAGRRFHAFGPGCNANQMNWQLALASWIADLPKPCGVFAANDWCAEQVVSLCESRRISVPGDIAVLGVDNDVDLCEHAAVPVSSISTNNALAGRLAAELLADCMERRVHAPVTRTFGATGVVRRASTRRFMIADGMVHKALEHIRRHACDRLEAGSVAEVMGCSRRWAELRFRKVTGHSILDEIHDVKFARALNILSRRGMTIEEIALECGYESTSFFRKVFKQRTGLSPRDWRNAQM